MNLVVLSGYLTSDVEAQEINDKSLCKFTIACSQGDQTLFMPVEAWDMKHLPKYLHKGSKVLAQGYLKQQTWQTDDKERRSRILMVGFKIEFLDPPPNKGKRNTESSN